jgi:hypothetical protein
MKDLVDDRPDSVRLKMALVDSEFEQEFRNAMNYCGRPLAFEFRRFETGVRQGRVGTMPAVKFTYGVQTQRAPACAFAVEVISQQSGSLRVAAFGPLRISN